MHAPRDARGYVMRADALHRECARLVGTRRSRSAVDEVMARLFGGWARRSDDGGCLCAALARVGALLCPCWLAPGGASREVDSLAILSPKANVSAQRLRARLHAASNDPF